MKKALGIIGLALFYLTYPLSVIVLHNTDRSRLIVRCNKRILLTKGYFSSGQWTLPGGGIHHGEAVEASLTREVREETGLIFKANDFKLLGVRPLRYRGFHFTCHYYLVDVPTQLPVRAAHEIMEVRWLDWRSVKQKKLAVDVINGLALTHE